MEKQKENGVRYVIVLLFMFALTALLLLIGAALVYYRDLSSQTARIMITVIYILTGLAGGFLIGKLMKVRKFVWGILAGLGYFACLLIISLTMNHGAIEDVVQLLITFVLVTASSMIGGMIS